MENLNELLKICMQMRMYLVSGTSVYLSIKKVCEQQEGAGDPFFLSQWLSYYEQTGLMKREGPEKQKYFEPFLIILYDGLRGYPIYKRIDCFESELIEICELQLQKRIDRLPYELMVPLLLFLFPAYLLMILGPILNMLLSAL